MLVTFWATTRICLYVTQVPPFSADTILLSSQEQGLLNVSKVKSLIQLLISSSLPQPGQVYSSSPSYVL